MRHYLTQFPPYQFMGRHKKRFQAKEEQFRTAVVVILHLRQEAIRRVIDIIEIEFYLDLGLAILPVLCWRFAQPSFPVAPPPEQKEPTELNPGINKVQHGYSQLVRAAMNVSGPQDRRGGGRKLQETCSLDHYSIRFCLRYSAVHGSRQCIRASPDPTGAVEAAQSSANSVQTKTICFCLACEAISANGRQLRSSACH